jgi:hypothetical protein
MSFLNEFTSAVENEICNDERSYHLSFTKPEDYYFLPRPTKWLSSYSKNQKLIFCFGFLLYYFWLFGGALIFFTYQLIKSIAVFARVPSQIAQMTEKNEFALGFSERAMDIINKNSIGHEPQAWIVLPWVSSVNKRTSNYFNLFSMLSISDFFYAWLLSLQSVYLIHRSKSLKKWLLQSYTAFQWFLTRLALRKVRQAHFITSEHFDRWSILIDFVVTELRQTSPSSLSIVQHGILESLTDNESRSGLSVIDVKNKLKSVTSIFVYDEKSAQIFCNSILDSKCRPQISFFAPQIVLQKVLRHAGKISVLFVGHPICEDLHIQLLKELSDSVNVIAYYKPHPTNAPRQIVKDQSWILITDKLFFPEVDLLVSYPSTLVTEYAHFGISAVLHPINLLPKESGEILKQILELSSKISL